MFELVLPPIVVYNVDGLPQGWYFITVSPATEAD